MVAEQLEGHCSSRLERAVMVVAMVLGLAVALSAILAHLLILAASLTYLVLDVLVVSAVTAGYSLLVVAVLTRRRLWLLAGVLASLLVTGWSLLSGVLVLVDSTDIGHTALAVLDFALVLLALLHK